MWGAASLVVGALCFGSHVFELHMARHPFRKGQEVTKYHGKLDRFLHVVSMLLDLMQ